MIGTQFHLDSGNRRIVSSMQDGEWGQQLKPHLGSGHLMWLAWQADPPIIVWDSLFYAMFQVEAVMLWGQL